MILAQSANRMVRPGLWIAFSVAGRPQEVIPECTRSRGGEERRSCSLGEMSFDGGGEVLEYVSFFADDRFRWS